MCEGYRNCYTMGYDPIVASKILGFAKVKRATTVEDKDSNRDPYTTQYYSGFMFSTLE